MRVQMVLSFGGRHTGSRRGGIRTYSIAVSALRNCSVYRAAQQYGVECWVWLVGFNSGPHDGVLVVRSSRTLVLDIVSASLLYLARKRICIHASLYGNSLEDIHTFSSYGWSGILSSILVLFPSAVIEFVVVFLTIRKPTGEHDSDHFCGEKDIVAHFVVLPNCQEDEKPLKISLALIWRRNTLLAMAPFESLNTQDKGERLTAATGHLIIHLVILMRSLTNHPTPSGPSNNSPSRLSFG